jgi:hypothetical protein
MERVSEFANDMSRSPQKGRLMMNRDHTAAWYPLSLVKNKLANSHLLDSTLSPVQTFDSLQTSDAADVQQVVCGDGFGWY